MKIIANINKVIVVFVAILSLSSCKDTWLMYDTTQSNTLIFAPSQVKDTLNQEVISLVFIPENIIEHKIKLNMMGIISPEERTFEVIAIDDTATTFAVSQIDSRPIVHGVKDIHYSIKKAYVPANSQYGYIDIDLNRTSDMIDNVVSIVLQISETDLFKPIPSNNRYRIILTDGEPTCPPWWSNTVVIGWQMYLGDFNPLKFRKFIDLYHEMKDTNPLMYKTFEDKYGEFMDKEGIKPGFYQTDSPAIWAKYVLCPLYDYFKENYPDAERGGYKSSETTSLTDKTGGWRDPKALYR